MRQCKEKQLTGGITITDIKSSDIEQHIREKIKEGLDDEYLHLVKELEKFFYPEDIAAAAIMLYIGQGGRDEVRRRTLSKAPFVPLRTKESLGRSPNRLPAVQPQARSAGYGAPRRPSPAVQQQSRQAPQGAPRRPLPAKQQPSRPAGQGAPRRPSPASQPQSRPAGQGAPRRSPPGTVAQKSYGGKQTGQQGQKGHGERDGQQRKRR